jgi:hypothetical protein
VGLGEGKCDSGIWRFHAFRQRLFHFSCMSLQYDCYYFRQNVEVGRPVLDVGRCYSSLQFVALCVVLALKVDVSGASYAL